MTHLKGHNSLNCKGFWPSLKGLARISNMCNGAAENIKNGLYLLFSNNDLKVRPNLAAYQSAYLEE